MCNLLLYGDYRLHLHTKCIILESTPHFINQTKRFTKQSDEHAVLHHPIETI